MNDRDFSFKKSLGQNFLQDNNIIKRIVNTVDWKEETLVIEVGPGSGALTKELVKYPVHVLAYEIDSRLEWTLDQALKGCSNITLIYDDFLKRNVKEDLKSFSYQHLIFVSNLPYYITTPIITKLIEEDLFVEEILVMVQKEVGERFFAKPKTKEYNSLSVFLQYHYEIKKEFVVSRNAFLPKPNVDSIIVKMVRKDFPLFVKNKDQFYRLVRDSFRFKRKTLKNNLKEYPLSDLEKVLQDYHYSLSSRAEELPLEVFVAMSNLLS